MEGKVEDLLRANRQCNPFANLGVKALGGNRDFIFPREQVRGCKKAVRVRDNCGDNSCRDVGDSHLSLRYQSLGRIAYGAIDGSSGYLSSRRCMKYDSKHQKSC